MTSTRIFLPFFFYPSLPLFLSFEEEEEEKGVYTAPRGYTYFN